MGKAENEWWNEFFTDDYADFGLTVSDEEAETARQSAVDFLIRTLGLDAGALVFDQCCGIGRISLPLARRGVRVVGVDRMESYVRRAQNSAVEERLPCAFHQGDAFDFVPAEKCDAAVNWFTSFGHRGIGSEIGPEFATLGR